MPVKDRYRNKNWYTILKTIRKRCKHRKSYVHAHTVKPGYNDTGLYDASPIASDIVVPINSSLSTITLHFYVTKTDVQNDTKYSVPLMTL